MKVVNDKAELRSMISALHDRKLRCGFVPTMGNLHAGHLAMVDKAASQCDRVIVSIFVNPMQFGAGEDLDAYPRTPEEDQRLLAEHEADILYRPREEDIYPEGLETHTRVEVPVLSETLCGLSRPGHFTGVATVVNKLFNIVQPDVAYFGKKDYQQLMIIRKMVRDLAMNLEIVGLETVRLQSGLAMSSRNNYLSAAEQEQAAQLYQVMQETAARIKSTPGQLTVLENDARKRLAEAGFRTDYFTVRNRADLSEAGVDDRELVLLAAAWLGRTRLIDNLEFTLPETVD